MPLNRRLLLPVLALLLAGIAQAAPPARPLTTEEAVALLARTPLAACDEDALKVMPDGTRNPAQLGCVFDRQGAAVDAILEQAARKGPVGGAVTFRFTIAPDGTVHDVGIAAGSASVRAFEAELVEAISRFTFPAQPVQPWTSTHTLNFHSH